MTLDSFLAQPPHGNAALRAINFAAHWTQRDVRKGANLTLQGGRASDELILLKGRVASVLSDGEGRTVCLGLFVGPCVITPIVARTREGISLVSLEALSDVRVARMANDTLINMMLSREIIRDWANGILHEELARKSDREWCLTALGGAERLAWFRARYQGYEDLFSHALLATFLGITPVTFSRLRGKQSIK